MGRDVAGRYELLGVLAFREGGGELGYNGGFGDNGGSRFQWEFDKYGARVASSRRPNSTLKVLSRTTPPSHFYCQRTLLLTMWFFAQSVSSRETWEGLLPGVSLDSIPSG